MIFKNNKEVSGIYKDNKVITAVYKGSTLVWQAISSCFGAGYWVDKFPWKNTDAWRN